jgi:PAS domain-containing protein
MNRSAQPDSKEGLFDPALASQIIGSLAVGVIVWADDGAIVSANRAALTMIGESRAPQYGTPQ